jgi:pantoate--beta-alanine ligase
MTADRPIERVRTIAELRARVRDWRAAGHGVGLVPTMGALHDGHLSLVRRSLGDNGRTCVTLFVNPAQFGPNEDFAVYPRSEDEDAAKLSALGAHLQYAPAADEIYSAGFTTKVSVPGLGDRLEGEFRPGFFTGVATVVTKLLLQSLPDRAYFGEKDYQQCRVIRRLVADLDIPVRIEACPTVREADGLALSSRNAYLDAAQRTIAPVLYATLRDTADRIAGGEAAKSALNAACAALTGAGFSKVDYVALADAETLAPLKTLAGPARLLAAAWLGGTRLIDNVAVDPI